MECTVTSTDTCILWKLFVISRFLWYDIKESTVFNSSHCFLGKDWHFEAEVILL